MSVLRSRDNPRVKRWAKLVRDARLRREERRVVIEGPNLVETALKSGARIHEVLVAESAVDVHRQLLKAAERAPIVLSDTVLKSIVGSEAPQGIAAELDLPSTAAVKGNALFLEGVQDPGNVGAILRSAAAFGIASAVLDAGCAEAWSPKVLRAAAGAHFALSIRQVEDLDEALAGFQGKLVCTLAHGGTPLSEADLSGTVGWIFGSEGQGVTAAVQRKAALRLHIPTRSVESLNVAAAAAVCFYAAINTPGAGS
jgi:TrmH family RNA methyltransferase